MTGAQDQIINTLFANEQACVSYLFKKRWPLGFRCPFCGTEQREMAPAYTVVCRYCRKQTSITAHTLMHGTKKNLVAWFQISLQFCFRDKGISAREVQRHMKLASYQTAWRWLQKIRHGAALAESSPIGGKVLFDYGSFSGSEFSEHITPEIAIALELNHDVANQGRVRFSVLASPSPNAIEVAINNLIFKNTTLLTRNQEWISNSSLRKQYILKKASREQLIQTQLLIQETKDWLNSLYRGAIDISYMQTYLAEFSFRHNTASWSDRLSVFDHLMTGLISSTEDDHSSLKYKTSSTRKLL
ncbi:MAG: transposase [Deltaproteobacteria bacterium]|nr:transposase [Deltaproteobacteria bacterium]